MESFQSYFGVIVGGCIGFLSSLVMFVISKRYDRKGKLLVVCKRTNSDCRPWGFHLGQEGMMCFFLPLDIEILNASGVNRLMRDFSVSIWRNGVKLCKLKQLDRQTKNEVTVQSYGVDNYSYSFIARERSVCRVKCAFMVKRTKQDASDLAFDQIKASYFDEHGREREALLASYDGDWSLKTELPDDDWIELKWSKRHLTSRIKGFFRS